MELNWYCTDVSDMRHQCWWGLLWIFQKATREPTGKAKLPLSEGLISHNWHSGKQGCNYQFHNHKDINPCKYWVVTSLPFIKTLSNSVTVLFVAKYCLTFVHSVFFVQSVDCSIQCLIIQCIFLFWYWNCIPGISIPILQQPSGSE